MKSRKCKVPMPARDCGQHQVPMIPKKDLPFMEKKYLTGYDRGIRVCPVCVHLARVKFRIETRAFVPEHARHNIKNLSMHRKFLRAIRKAKKELVDAES